MKDTADSRLLAMDDNVEEVMNSWEGNALYKFVFKRCRSGTACQ